MNMKILVICIVTAVLISLVPLSVYADYEDSYLMASLPTNTVSRNSTEETPYTYAYYGQVSNTDYFLNIYKDSSVSTSNRNAYFFLAHAESNASNKYRLCIAVEGAITDDNESVVVSVGKSYSSGGDYTLNKSSSYDAVTNLTYNYPSTYIYCLPYCMTSEGTNESAARNNGLAELRTAIDNGTAGGGTSVSAKVANITIQPGTVAYVSVTGGSFTLKATFTNKFSGGLLSSARYWYATSLPTGNFIVGNGNNINPVIWTADEPFDMSRRTYNGIMQVNNLSSGYYAIYNPIEGVSGNNSEIYATFTEAVSVVQYPLNNTYDGNVLVGEGSEDNVYVADNSAIDNLGNVQYIHYDVDSNGNTITSSAISLPAGGNNIIDESDNSISGLVDRILYLLAAPIRHIQQLFDSGNAFMQWLGSLWHWLPEPVYVILTSALVVLMVIGVIKFLWK